MTESNSMAKILYEKIREVEQEIANPEDIDLYTKLEGKFICVSFLPISSLLLGLLRKEIDKTEDLDYAGICQDSDAELEESDEDSVYSETEINRRRSIPYNLDKQFEIVTKRDHNGWSYSHIHHCYKFIDSDHYGRTQLSRFICIT